MKLYPKWAEIVSIKDGFLVSFRWINELDEDNPEITRKYSNIGTAFVAIQEFYAGRLEYKSNI